MWAYPGSANDENRQGMVARQKALSIELYRT